MLGAHKAVVVMVPRGGSPNHTADVRSTEDDNRQNNETRRGGSHRSGCRGVFLRVTGTDRDRSAP